jgi:(2Fe-2S) ferredoxin
LWKQSNLRRILKEHIEEGRPLREWIAAKMRNLARA